MFVLVTSTSIMISDNCLDTLPTQSHMNDCLDAYSSPVLFSLLFCYRLLIERCFKSLGRFTSLLVSVLFMSLLLYGWYYWYCRTSTSKTS